MQPSGFSSFSALFIIRPIGTALLAAGLFLLGAVAYVNLPVASLPTVDFPTLRVQASRPGADQGHPRGPQALKDAVCDCPATLPT